MSEIILKIKNDIFSAKNSETIQKKAGRLFISFFILMAVFTVLSRAADSLTVAKVSTTMASRGNLSFETSGSGTIEAKKLKVVHSPENFTVEEIFAAQGKSIDEGSPLFRLNTDEIKEVMDTKKTEVKKLEISFNQEKLLYSEYVEPITSGEELLEEKNRELEHTIQNQQYEIEMINIDIQNAEKELKKANEDYKEAETNSYDKALENAEKELREAQKELDELLYSKDEELKEADRKIQDRKRELDKLNNTNNELQVQHAIDRYNNAMANGDQAEIDAADLFLNQVLYGSGGASEHKTNVRQAETELKRAKDDKDSINEMWSKKIEWAEQDLQEAQDNIEKVKRRDFDKEEVLRAEQSAIDSAEKNLESLKRELEKKSIEQKQSIENIHNDIENANKQIDKDKEQYSKSLESKDRESQISNYKLQSMKLDIETIQKEINGLSELLNSDGIIYSPINGIVGDINIKIGEKSSGTALLINDKSAGFIFRGTIAENAEKYISYGDKITITPRGDKKGINSSVESLVKNSDGSFEITAIMPEGEYGIGTECSFESYKSSDAYDLTIPLSALRDDGKTKFVLIAEQRQSILGNVITAVKVDVELIENDSRKAAIKGTLSSKDYIIFESNKPISQGDRVRIEQ